MTIGYSAFTTPTGNLAPTLNNGGFNANFQNTADFTNSSGTSCAAGEYRQYVMGSFQVDGSTLTHVLCGSTVLSPSVYQEDGCPSGSCTAYGHRSCPTSSLDYYNNPDQATGSHFAMSDTPGWSSVTAGKTYTINLSFQGSLINTSNNSPLVTRYWTVQGSATATASACEAASVGLDASDRVLAVHLARNSITELLEAHVVIVRKPDRPPLSATAVKLVLRDAAGGIVPADAPEVHEITSRGRATTSIVYPLLPSCRPPVKAELSAAHLNVVLEVLER